MLAPRRWLIWATYGLKRYRVVKYLGSHHCATATASDDQISPIKKMSKAMEAYMERAKHHDDFMEKEEREFELGKRHLANIMGENPETFTQDKINECIKYLFPSGIFTPSARPTMRPPVEVFPKRKAAEFDVDGRPFHFLFYTMKPNFYNLMYDIAEKMEELNSISKQRSMPLQYLEEAKLNLLDSEWLAKEDLELKLLEKLKDSMYEDYVLALKRIQDHPLAYLAKTFLMNQRKRKSIIETAVEIPPLLYDEAGNPFMIQTGHRKTASANVTVRGNGSGLVQINGEDISYFYHIKERHQLLFPLQLTGYLGKVDIIAQVSGGGTSSQAGAIRLGISLALRSFVDAEMVETLRIAGLLTRDVRKKERCKPGHDGPRKPWKWKKR